MSVVHGHSFHFVTRSILTQIAQRVECLVQYQGLLIIGDTHNTYACFTVVVKHNRSLKVAVQGPDFWPTPSTVVVQGLLG
jgi:hypothetical protein